MKRIFLSSLSTIIVLALAITIPAFADVNDFYFESFEADYYLYNNTSGATVKESAQEAAELYSSNDGKDTDAELSTNDKRGNLRIEETLIAVFPETDQNHGIERCIPLYSNANGKLDIISLSVSQDDATAEFSLRYGDEGSYCLRIGNANEYIHGKVKYKISYTYNNVIIHVKDKNYQELYWDTNGTWAQSFDSLTAHLHIPSEFASNLTDNPFNCYVGLYNEFSQDRCTISESTEENGKLITFSTSNLSAGENLTMNVMFSNDTFTATDQEVTSINTEPTTPDETNPTQPIVSPPTKTDHTLLVIIISVALPITCLFIILIISKRNKPKTTTLASNNAPTIAPPTTSTPPNSLPPTNTPENSDTPPYKP